jgi:transposase
MQQSINLNTATYVGIDCHPTEHTALAMNRFEDEKGILRFENSQDGISQFLSWLPTIDKHHENIIIGVEGGGNSRHALIAHILTDHKNIYEVNPLYTKQRRQFGTNPEKSDPRDAKLIAEVLTRKLGELPQITAQDLSSWMLVFRKLVWFYEEITFSSTAIQNQLHGLKRERDLSIVSDEKSLLTFMIKQKQQDLRRIRKTQKDYVKRFTPLLKRQGSNLISMKGIDTVLAAKIVVHSGGIERFKNIRAFINYSGISPKEKSSGRKKRKVKNAVGTNRKLHGTLYLAALCQLCWNPKAKEYFEKKLKEGKTKKHALTCLMNRTACIIYGMLKSGEAYRG